MKIESARLWLNKLLSQSNVIPQDSTNQTSVLLLSHLTQVAGTDIYLNDFSLSKSEQQQLVKLADYLMKGYPLQYITGTQFFYNLELDINKHCLIPRPDTEVVVEIALKLLKNIANPAIIDLGTGSGAIALSLKANLNNASIFALEKFSDTLNVARQNASKHKFDINFIQADWNDNWKDFMPIKKNGSFVKFDAIISNPPYIDSQDIHLQNLIFEPYEALVAINQGLVNYKIIIEQATSFLKNNGYLIFEHGYNQAKAVNQILKKHSYKNCQTYNDYNQKQRVTYGQK